MARKKNKVRDCAGHAAGRLSPADIELAWEQAQDELSPRPVFVLPSSRYQAYERFAEIYPQLCVQPRASRRRLQRKLSASLAAVGLILALGRASPVEAANITVNNNGTAVADDGVCTLIEAITAANSDTASGAAGGECAAGSGADTITLDGGGTYTHSAAIGVNALPVITSEITIDGNLATIQRGGASPPAFRIIEVADSGNLTLNDTTISGGMASGGVPTGFGGGISSFGSLELNRSSVSGNSASDDGGGIAAGIVTLNDSTVSGNSAGSSGGGIYAGTATLNNSAVTGNSAGSDAGGIYAYNSALNDSTVSNNSAPGIVGTNTTLVRSVVSGNSSGGIYVSYGNISATDTTITGNLGRGISSTSSSVSLTNTTVSNNNGGGLRAEYSTPINITNSTISGNSTGGRGGGFLTYDSGTINITNSTITGNSAGANGGGVFAYVYSDYATLNISRSVITGNSSASGAAEVRAVASNYGPPSIFTRDNVFGHAGLTTAQALSGFTADASDNTATSDGQDPTALSAILDTTLADNGGPTMTHALVTGSPAIDAGGAGCPPPATDQRGVARPQGLACDIGAFELEPPPLDTDGDTVPDSVDNCIEVGNADQRDTDGDGIGNICDPDVAAPNDCLVNFIDLNVYRNNFFAPGDLDTDNNGDGITNFLDLNIVRDFFFGPPGPSANGCALSDVVLVEGGDPGYVNQSIGTLLNGTSSAFPASGDPFLDFATAPDLSPAQSVLGGWLDQPVPDLSAPGWSSTPVPVPSNWPVDTEIAIVYPIESGGITNLVAEFGVDNGMFVWLDGVFIGGALRPGGVVLGEHTFNLGDLGAGTHYLQIVLEDHGLTNGFAVRITADEVVLPAP